jgi:hypothetical protein
LLTQTCSSIFPFWEGKFRFQQRKFFPLADCDQAIFFVEAKISLVRSLCFQHDKNACQSLAVTTHSTFFIQFSFPVVVPIPILMAKGMYNIHKKRAHNRVKAGVRAVSITSIRNKKTIMLIICLFSRLS